MRLEVRWGEGKLERMPALAAELVQMNVDIIVAAAAPSETPAERETRIQQELLQMEKTRKNFSRARVQSKEEGYSDKLSKVFNDPSVKRSLEFGSA